MAALMAWSTSRESCTVDEPFHLVRGLSYVWTRDARLSYAHPPLAHLIAALPASMAGPRDDLRAYEGYERGDVSSIAVDYVDARYEVFAAQLAKARLVMIGITVALGLYLYAFTWSRFGRNTARFALLFY